MEFFDALNARHSIRAYAGTPVEDEKLDRIFEAINQAPSAGNLQAFEVYLVTSGDDRAELANAALEQDFVAQATVVLVFCAHAARSAERYGKRGISLYCLQDATIACTFAMLAATALGLSSVWVGAFRESEVSRIINAPQTHHPVAMLPVG
ncbi:MAG: nitroreductase family protein, partial [Alphaproteobacteria bacterium]|nr:nitroreductase family protein [Alphaproteobacteria bacterium]